MTLTEMARHLGLRVPTLHGYSTGRRSVPLPVAVAIEDLTNGLVTVRELAKPLSLQKADFVTKPTSEETA